MKTIRMRHTSAFGCLRKGIPMYFVLNFLLQLIIYLHCAATISFCLTPKYPRLRSLAIYGFISFFLFAFKFFSFGNQIALTLVTFSIQLAVILFVLLAFNDSCFKKLVVLSVIFVSDVILEYTALFTLKATGSYATVLEPGSKEFTALIARIVPLQIIFNQLFLFIWKYAFHKKSSLTIFIFSLIPIFQMFLASVLFILLFQDSTITNSFFIILCSLIALLANAILLYVILHRQEKQSIQAAYLELQELYKMESEYYQTLEDRHKELSKIRHDYNNHLAVLYALISSGKAEAAKELAASLKTHICESADDGAPLPPFKSTSPYAPSCSFHSSYSDSTLH